MAGGKTSSDVRGGDDTAPATTPPSDDNPATTLAARGERYRLGAELGRGGMGRVVEAYDTQLGRTVALKEILPRAGSNLTRRFAREVQLTARLEHPSIVPLYDAGVTIDGRPYYVMRRVTGRPFDELILRARDLGERLTLLPELLAAIDAVAHAHRRGVIHRDLKPGNILVGELGETVVIDWGLAKVIGETDSNEDGPAPLPGDSLQTQIGAVFGTPGFMAPEQARGEELDPGGDVYALGACLYQLLAGKAPLSGKSATEVIEKTHRHEIVPLARVAPAAPPELVAIVEKALSYEAARRYPDAGALAEDVRRFLDGQLVAAHRYTKRQRIARFVRRHRAPLAVAALAMFAVAVLAWVGVRRIVRERDAARDARELAVVAAHEAEVARDRERDRSDALLVTQARSLLATNPTEAVALLKQLGPRSPHLDAARAIAQAAALAGVAWAMEGPPVRGIPWLDATGTRLAIQGRREGAVWVYDLLGKRLVRSRNFPTHVIVGWVANGQLLVVPGERAPQLWNPSTDTLVDLATAPASTFEISDDGRTVLLRFEKGVALVDIDTRAVRPLATDRAIADMELAPDGSWLALHDGAHIVVLDAAGKELLRRPTTRTIYLHAARAHRLAFAEDARALFECTFEPAAPAACAQVPTPPTARVLELHYLGRELFMRLDAELHAWSGTRLRRVSTRSATQLLAAAGEHLLISPEGGKLHFFAPYGQGTIALPSAPLNAKISAHRGAPRIVVVGDNTPAIVVVELGAIEPRFVAGVTATRASFSDDETVLLHDGAETSRWRWFDVATQQLAPFGDLGTPMPTLVDLDERSRTIVRSLSRAGVQLVHVRRGHAPSVMATFQGDNPLAGWGFSLAGDATVFSVGDSRLLGAIGEAPARELFALDAPIADAAGLGPLRVGAISTKGELLRGTIETMQYERHRLPGASAIGRDIAGRTLVAAGSKLYAWDADVTLLGDLGDTIIAIRPVEGGAAIMLRDYSALVVEAGAKLVTHRILGPSSRAPVFSRDGRLALGTTAHGQITVVELPSRASWRIASWDDTVLNPDYAIAPSSRRLAQYVPGGLVVRELPNAGADLHAFLARLTNATVDDSHALVWPWQSQP